MSAIRIHFDTHFHETRKVLVAEDGTVSEHEQVWLWDLYCAHTLFELGADTASARLQQQLTEWAVNAAGKAFSPNEELRQAGLFVIDPALALSDKLDASSACVIEIAIEPQPQSWPGMRVTVPDDLDADRRAASVLALAQHFLQSNPLFVRELPIHILALKKFYADALPATDPASVAQAPVFALNKAMQFYQDLSQGKRPGH
jgi:hypothetical protein